MLPGAGPASLSRRAPQTALRRTCQMAASGVCVEDRTAPAAWPSSTVSLFDSGFPLTEAAGSRGPAFSGG